MDKQKFYEKFKNMAPMKYYEANLEHPRAEEMFHNRNGEFFAMQKYDGEWCRAIIMEDEVLLQSRSVSRVTGTYGDKTEHVPHITKNLLNSYPAGTVLLGEIAFMGFNRTSREVGSVMRCKPPKAIERQTEEENKLHFYIFDVLAYDYKDLMDLPFESRFIPEHTMSSASYIHVAANDSENGSFESIVDYVWGYGGEGIMIVRKDMMYQPGSRRAWQTLKVKKKLGKLTAKVLSTIEPNKFYEGDQINTWPYVIDEEAVTKPFFYGWKNGVIVEYKGRVVRVTSGLTDYEREQLSQPEIQEKIVNGELYAEVTGMELTEDSIRHPIFIKLIEVDNNEKSSKA